MSREIEIRDRIARLDPAAFQNLAQELLSQHFRYDKPVHRGLLLTRLQRPRVRRTQSGFYPTTNSPISNAAIIRIELMRRIKSKRISRSA